MNWQEKKLYVISLIDKKCVNRRTVNNLERESRRNSTFTYHLKVDGQRMPVCKEIFLSTLGLNQRMVYNWILNQDVGTSIPENTTSTSSTQAAHNRQTLEQPEAPTQKRSQNRVLTLCQSCIHITVALKRVILNRCSHQWHRCTRNTLTRCKASQNRLLRHHHSLFNKKNLSLFKPKKNLCYTCCGYDSKVEYSEHIKRKKEARTAKETDKERAISGNVWKRCKSVYCRFAESSHLS